MCAGLGAIGGGLGAVSRGLNNGHDSCHAPGRPGKARHVVNYRFRRRRVMDRQKDIHVAPFFNDVWFEMFDPPAVRFLSYKVLENSRSEFVSLLFK